MSISLAHVSVRDGVYQYQRRVPLHIQRDTVLFAQRFKSRPLFRQSLRSKDLARATLAYGAIHQRFEALIAPPSATPCPTLVRPAAHRAVTDHEIAAIADRYEKLTARPFEQLYCRANVDDVAAAELARMGSELELDAEAVQDALRARQIDADSPFLQPVAEAVAIIEEQGLLAPEGSNERSAIIDAVRIGAEKGYKHISGLLRGDVLPTLAVPAAAKAISAVTLASVVERYLTIRKPPRKNVVEIRLALQQFEHIVGRKRLPDVTRQDVHAFVEHLSNQKVGGKTAGSVVRHLSPATIRKRIGLLGAAINFAANQGLFDGKNPLSGIALAPYEKDEDKAVMPDKRRLLVDELNAIFTHPWFTGCRSPKDIYTPGQHRLEDSRFWVLIVALFTGCRASELGGMKIEEVKLNHPQPHFVVRMNEHRKTKNRRSRCVPILDSLLELGFATYVSRVARSGAERLFPDWLPPKQVGVTGGDLAWSNSTIIRALNRQVIPTALKGRLVEGVRREVTFHSLRGAFKAMLVAGNGVPLTVVNSVVAHKNSELDERYIGQLTIEETYPLIRGCVFKGLQLPSLPT